ncbi:hypothetical protein NIES4075_72400 [Tolypothrix sp. NIES-4075]|uniref:transposase n=1 Tax=Tolypothrix sp. NIES-4075 TaxID=2005459 RepID=UPI000B5C222D|nr:transposase [Tolypothrix sp. NIES-4075]GAX46219.1 hypothetical protein NIES4075_72400 [Tolypothrix sp. NIES-4075]
MRFEYRDWVLGIDPHNLVFVDESGLKLGMTRLYGRASSGERLYDSTQRNQGKNISLIGALSLDGLIATMSIPGSVNTLCLCDLYQGGFSAAVVGGSNSSNG